MTTQSRRSEKEEMVVVGADVGVGSGADDLALEKECLLAELDVERDEMRRRLLAFEMTRGGREYVDGNDVEEEWKEKVCEKSSEEEKCLDKDVVLVRAGQQDLWLSTLLVGRHDVQLGKFPGNIGGVNL